MGRHTLQPPGLFQSQGLGFSQVVIAQPGRTVHVAGQVAYDAEQRVVGETRDEQFSKVLENIVTAVRAAGGAPEHIVSLTLFIPNFEPETETALIAHRLVTAFGSNNPPASSWIGVQTLADPRLLIEVAATAVIP